jgi:hypothetical protein
MNTNFFQMLLWSRILAGREIEPRTLILLSLCSGGMGFANPCAAPPVATPQCQPWSPFPQCQPGTPVTPPTPSPAPPPVTTTAPPPTTAQPCGCQGFQFDPVTALLLFGGGFGGDIFGAVHSHRPWPEFHKGEEKREG